MRSKIDGVFSTSIQLPKNYRPNVADTLEAFSGINQFKLLP